ncbi:hypothetical protein LP415_02595 [Polaromonas sp. P1(28)-8]|nr:hypothetical protein LP415_02595 [Polaromonas sp. P1(28)-8]
MAVIYYVKDGAHPNNTDAGRELPLSTIESRIQGRRVQYLGVVPPEINKDAPSQYYCRVVVEVEANDSPSAPFDKVGFFLLTDLSPSQAEPIIFKGAAVPYRL